MAALSHSWRVINMIHDACLSIWSPLELTVRARNLGRLWLAAARNYLRSMNVGAKACQRPFSLSQKGIQKGPSQNNLCTFPDVSSAQEGVVFISATIMIAILVFQDGLVIINMSMIIVIFVLKVCRCRCDPFIVCC